MKEYYLNYFKKFKCLQGKCPDTCCKNWGVDIDDVTHRKYKELKSPYGYFIHKTLKHKKQLFSAGETCPFLNKEGLCDIVIQLGNDYLCDICKKYPRVINEYGSDREHNLTLSCIESVNLLLDEKNISVIKEETNEKIKTYNKFDSKLYPHLRKTRELLFTILKKDIPLLDKIAQLENVGKDIQYLLFVFDATDKLDFKNYNQKMPPLLKKDLIKILRLYIKLECLNLSWKTKLKNVLSSLFKNNFTIENILSSCKILDKKCNNILFYYIFKYYLESVNDFAPLAKIRFAISIVIVEILLYSFNELNKESDLKTMFKIDVSNLSKEVEHSIKNVTKLDNYFKKHTIFTNLNKNKK